MQKLKAITLRPEMTAVAGTILVFLFFVVTAGHSGFLTRTGLFNVGLIAADVGIIAAPATLLMVAGEFDLSVGSMAGLGGIAFAYPLVDLHLPVVVALLCSLVVCCLCGAIQGVLLVLTGMPSFIITLAGMFVILGLIEGGTQVVTGNTQIDNVMQASGNQFVARLFTDVLPGGMPIQLVWWVVVTLVAAGVLSFTAFGNWCYAIGGNIEAAVRSGLSVGWVKITLFMAVAASACLVGIFDAYQADYASTLDGTNYQFEVVVAVFVGGAVMTGGYGSPIGSFFGALIYGMVYLGFYYTNIQSEWSYAFLGIALLIAVVVNTYVRRLALRAKYNYQAGTPDGRQPRRGRGGIAGVASEFLQRVRGTNRAIE
jgi:simple sugar transport system permease protein